MSLSRRPCFANVGTVAKFVLAVWTYPGSVASFGCEDPNVLLRYELTAVLTLGHPLFH